MSTATLDIDSVGGVEETLQYRALPTGAILGLVLGVLSVLTIVAGTSSFQACAFVALIPIVGAINFAAVAGENPPRPRSLHGPPHRDRRAWCCRSYS